ncbi:MAG: archease [Candidatus Brocadiales bacterium]
MMDEDKKYRLINHTADLGIEVYGEGLQELFSNAGFALFDIITDISRVKETTKRVITIEGSDLEQLIVNWLNELLYLHDVEGLLFKRFEVQEITDKNLKALIAGERYDPNKHIIETVVKAVTYHQLQVVQENNRWRAVIIIDL